MRRNRFRFSGCEIEHLWRGVSAVSGVGVFKAHIDKLAAIWRERDGRSRRPGRKRDRQAPRAGGQTFGLAPGGRNQPEMGGKSMVFVEEAAVTHVKGVVELVGAR